jgi:hypothetical protein
MPAEGPAPFTTHIFRADHRPEEPKPLFLGPGRFRERVCDAAAFAAEAGRPRGLKRTRHKFLENPTEMRAERAWGLGFGGSLSIDPTPVRAVSGKNVSQFADALAEGATVVSGAGSASDTDRHSRAQRLACTIARMPARTAGGSLDQASTTAARAGSAGSLCTSVCTSLADAAFPSGFPRLGSGLQIRHRRFDSDRSLCF